MKKNPALFSAAALAAALLAAPLAQAQNRVVASPDAPEAIGPYSQAIRAGNVLYLSGQIPIDPKTKKLMNEASIEDQTRLVLDNLKAVLAADGLTLADVVSTTVYMKDLNDFGKMNAVYGSYFTLRVSPNCAHKASRRLRRYKSSL